MPMRLQVQGRSRFAAAAEDTGSGAQMSLRKETSPVAAAEIRGFGALCPNIMTTEGESYGDPLHDWYSSPETDWEECKFLVPRLVGVLLECESEEPDDRSPQYLLESISWPGVIRLSDALTEGVDQHRVLTQVLSSEETGSEGDQLGDIAGMGTACVARLCKLEAQNKSLQEAVDKASIEHASHQLPCFSKFLPEAFNTQDAGINYPGVLQTLSEGNGGDPGQEGDEKVQEYLQTKTIPNEVVRTEMQKWIPSMQAEYNSLVHETQAVRPLSDQQFSAMLKDPNVQHELVPGRAIFTIKAYSGRLKTRVVACGCFQTGAARSREDKYASGISAEATRMLIRYAGLQQLQVGVLDIKTAFLHAPVVTPNSETVIVRVPAILRAAKVCSERYWVVDKALYGLDVAPRSWVLHRNQVLTEITELIPSKKKVRCFPMEEDANVWLIVDADTDQAIAYLALYVDDILIVSQQETAADVARTLESKWTTTPVAWSEEGSSLSFDGFEIERLGGSFIVHQKSYVKEILKQYSEITGISIVPCSRDVPELNSNLPDSELLKQAQALTGQLLWLAGRTRPDLSYAISIMGQGIVQDPADTVARGHQVIRYLRHAPDVGLKYGPPPETYGRWGQLQWKQTAGKLDLFSDASFLADSESRSVGCAQMYWAGGLIMWHCGRQPLLSASTAEAELIAMADAFGMGRSLRPFATALCAHADIQCHTTLYSDNAAAIQLCTLDAGSWRTRHLRLRGNLIRQAVDLGEWCIAHLEGVYMPADIGTKLVGPTRFEDLIHVMELHCPHLLPPRGPPNPKVASLKTGMTRLLIALMLFNQATTAKAWSGSQGVWQEGIEDVLRAILYGFGGYIGWQLAGCIHRSLKRVMCPRRPVSVTHVPATQPVPLCPPPPPHDWSEHVETASGVGIDNGTWNLPNVGAALPNSRPVSQLPEPEQSSEVLLDTDTMSVRPRHEDVVLQPEYESREIGTTAHGLDLPSHSSTYLTSHLEPALPHRSQAASPLLEDPTSDGSGQIDSVPHRPPTPTRDFEGYNRYISQLSPEEYHNLFAIPIPLQPWSESGSDVDSNERYARSFAGPDVDAEEDTQQQMVNNNNTVGSREVAMRRALEFGNNQITEVRSHIADLNQHAPSAVLYVDDEISSVPTGRLTLDNNASGQASGSNDVVGIPARQATVPPPPVTHRIPPLELQDATFRAQQREMFRLFQSGALQQVASNTSNESTDSGEYTIRDGSPASSGRHHSSRNSSRVGHSSAAGTPVSVTAAALAVAVISSSVPGAESTKSLSLATRDVWDEGSDAGSVWNLVTVGFVCWCLGLFMVWSCMRYRVEVKIESAVSLNSERQSVHTAEDLNIPNLPHGMTHRRPRTHRGSKVFLTPGGECIHALRSCSSLRMSSTVLQKHLCTICAQPGSVAPNDA